MSLHRKIVGWFVLFAALTIALFGLGDYLQSSSGLRFALETKAGSVAQQIASDIERAHDRAEAELLALGYAAAVRARPVLPPLTGRYTDVRVLRGQYVVYEADVIGSEPLQASGCAAGDLEFDLSFTDAAGRPHRIEARMPAEQFFASISSARMRLGTRSLTAVVRTEDGAPVFDSGCTGQRGDEAHPLAAAMVEGGSPDSVTFPDLDASAADDWVLAVVRTETPPWTAVSGVDYAEFAAPFLDLRRKYVILLAGVMLLALALVLTGVRRDMRRLSAITNAADAIGLGNFNVWLPPPTEDEVGRLTLALGRMSERLSGTLRQIEVSRSMAAVGELATYLSHEIRNPLSSIRLNLQMLERDLRTGTPPEDGEEVVELCLSELQRLDDVVRTVLEVGRTGRPATGSCDAHAVVRETAGILRRTASARGVEVELRLHAEDSQVAVESAALRSVLMNLVLNSTEALNGSNAPRISIATQLLDGEDGRLELRVADNGPGVPAHLRERIFDPFFTTKATGNGIGLPTALRTMQECRGMLRYEPSAESAGAEFVLELPLAQSKPAATPELAASNGLTPYDNGWLQ